MSYKVNINGYNYWWDHLSNLKQVGPGKYTVERRGTSYRIEGGKHAGGTRREWFLEGGNFNGPVNCTSLVDALRCLDTM